MAYRFFETKKHASLYQKYTIREPEEVLSLTLSYLEEKEVRDHRQKTEEESRDSAGSRLEGKHHRNSSGDRSEDEKCWNSTGGRLEDKELDLHWNSTGGRLEDKKLDWRQKGKPFGLALDVGCGTGQNTRLLAPHFQEVVGIDISEAQIQEAKNVGVLSNVSYIVAPAEKIPYEDGSVDLITASIAAHWFEVEEFLREADRVLKPSGCLALSCLYPHFDLHYKDCSKCLTDTFMEAFNSLLSDHGSERVEIMRSEYEEIFDAVPFADKTRVTKILLTYSISITELMGYVKTLFMFQNFSRKDPKAANVFVEKLQERILQIMGVSSLDTEMEIRNNFFCVLACKSNRQLETFVEVRSQ